MTLYTMQYAIPKYDKLVSRPDEETDRTQRVMPRRHWGDHASVNLWTGVQSGRLDHQMNPLTTTELPAYYLKIAVSGGIEEEWRREAL